MSRQPRNWAGPRERWQDVSRGRAIYLRSRLIRRGLILSAGLVLTPTTSMVWGTTPPALAQATCKATLAYAAGNDDRCFSPKRPVGTRSVAHHVSKQDQNRNLGSRRAGLRRHWLARNKLHLAKIRLTLAGSELAQSKVTYGEAQNRFATAKKLFERRVPVISEEEFKEKKLTCDRSREDVESKKAGVLLAEGELHGAEIVLEMYEVRSPVRGIIRTILKSPGEAVRALEPLMEIVPR